MKEMERKPYSSDTMRVRCPHCRKLYLVQLSDIQEAKPTFECVQCHSRFWLSIIEVTGEMTGEMTGKMDLSQEIIGLPLETKSSSATAPSAHGAQVKTESCPKCAKANPMGAAECLHCGIVIAKAKAQVEGQLPEASVAHSEALSLAWNRAMADYSNADLHAEFIRACHKECNLAFAAAQYGRLRKVMPADEQVRKAVREIQALGLVDLPERRPRSLKRFMPRLWQIPLLVATVMILTGVFSPVFRNMIGVGAAFLFLALALQFQLRRRS